TISPFLSVTVAGASTSGTVLRNYGQAETSQNDGAHSGNRSHVEGRRPPSLSLAPLFGPAFLDELVGAADCQGIGRHWLGDHGSRPDVSAVADFDGRYQGGIAANKSAFPDGGEVLPLTIVIAENGARADVAAGPDPR